MKRRVTTILTGIGFIVMQFSCSDNFLDGFSGADNVESHYSEQFMKNQEQALSQYRQLLDSFDDVPLKAKSGKGKRAQTDKIYPESYGGAYIDGDGKLVICVTDSSTNARSFSHYVNDSNTRLKATQYPLNTLKDVMERMNAHIKEHPDGAIAKNIDFFAIDEQANRVIVDVKQLDKGYEVRLRNLIADASCVVFQDKHGSFDELASTSLQSGAEIVANSSGQGFSLGIRASLDSEEGFITTGHAAWEEGESVKYDGDVFAKLVNFQNSGSVDAAFCEITDSDFEVNASAGGSIGTEAVGVKVVARGYNNTAYGEIWYTNVSSNGLTNMSAFAFDSGSTLTNGDSGGGVFVRAGGVLGVIKGKGSEPGQTNLCIYSKASKIQDALGVTIN
ncbi:hypothetical protein [Sphingobacterium sp. FBM7-1]|uniref:hypothetical protein n=1 Tax=Sphingobacterium sp. FBM7-1 TaxID=2886688 RepID=UPI001D0FC890|nr:hypothetical protein [Sphingobacterium sp. FBM7-1]MCC2600309.1 hypothetical protein [Sphingobacterium sp. FBM7-1]